MKSDNKSSVRYIYGKAEGSTSKYSLNLYSGKLTSSSDLLRYGAFFFLLFGVKIWTIATYGNATPFGDQWDAEAVLLYKPYLDHTLGWQGFIAAHNEHRILTTRILALGLLELNKIWNPLLQMIVNAVLHIFSIVLAVTLIKKVTGKNSVSLLLAFSFALIAIPYAWENIVIGFQSQFYFVLLFGIATIWLTITARPLRGKWWLGILCAILAFFSLASGVFAAAAAAFISIIFFVTGLRRNISQIIAIIILTSVFITGFYLTPSLPHQAQFKASSLRQFYDAFIAIFGWPVGANFLCVLICNVPALLFILFIFRSRPVLTDRSWFLAGLLVWVVAQALSISYGRAAVTGAPRYRDLFAMLVFVNFACLLSVLQYYFNTHKKRAIAFASVWTSIILISLSLYSMRHLPTELSVKQHRNQAEETNMKNYLATGDIAYLKNKPEWDIPYPDADELAVRIEKPGIKEILPSNITSPLRPAFVETQPANTFSINGYYSTTPTRADTAWGSYNTEKGDAAIGKMILHFKSNVSGKLAIPIAGYPLKEKIKLEFIQNNQVGDISINSNPAETWGNGYVNIKPGDFSIVATDSSTSTWVAIGNPSVVGRFDGFTNKVLSSHYFFIMTGLALSMILLLSGFLKSEAKSFVDSENTIV